MTSKLIFLISGALIGVSLGAFPAFAQQTGQPQESGVEGLEEITVTARRVEENIQRVPITITAFTADTVNQFGAMRVQDLAQSVPGIEMMGTEYHAAGEEQPITVRGLKANAVVYFADVPRGTSAGVSNTLDIDVIQILKGPQGTLFGLASNAGAEVINPHAPEDRFGGFFTIDMGDYNRQSMQGMINIPLVSDRVLFRAAAQIYHRDGYVIDIANGVDEGRMDYYTLRPSLKIRIGDNIENTTIYQYTHAQTNEAPIVLDDINFVNPLIARASAIVGGTPAAYLAVVDQVLARQLQLGPYKVDGISQGCPVGGNSGSPALSAPTPITANSPDYSCPHAFSTDYTGINTTKWTFGAFSLKNIFGIEGGSSTLGVYQPTELQNVNAPVDVDGSILPALGTSPLSGNRQVKLASRWSDELQLAGKAFDNKLDFVLGIFDRLVLGNPTPSYSFTVWNIPALTTAYIDKWSTRDRSVYGQGNYNLGDYVPGLTLTAGYRYSWDTAELETFALNPNDLSQIIGHSGGPNSPSGHALFQQGSWTSGLQYQLNPNVMLYFTASKGYSAGGLQNIAGYQQYKPESLTNLEPGIKATFALTDDWTARVNASYYYGFYDDVQVNVTALVTNATTGAQTFTTVTSNAAQGLISGVDAEFTLALRETFDVRTFFSLENTKYTKFMSINSATGAPLDLSDTPFGRAPKYKAGIRPTYHLPLDRTRIGDIGLSASFTYRSKFYDITMPLVPTDPANPQNTGSVCTIQRTAANGYGPLTAAIGGTAYRDCSPPEYMLDFMVSWNNVLGHPGVTAGASITNVLNYVGEHFAGPAGLGFESTSVAPPRMFVFSLGYKF